MAIIRNIMKFLARKDESINKMGLAKREDKQSVSLAFQEAQKAGFQFRYKKHRRSMESMRKVVITRIPITQEELIIPAYIDKYPVRIIDKNCNFLVTAKINSLIIYLPHTLQKIGEHAFENRENFIRDKMQPILGDVVTEVYFPDQKIEIGAYAFARQTKLMKLHFQGKEQIIGQYAFLGCHTLETVKFGSSVSLGDHSFFNCKALKQVEWGLIKDAGAEVFRYTPFLKEREIFILGDVLQKYHTLDKQIAVPNGITKIGSMAFEGCENLERVSLPESVRVIEENAFESCSKLSQINLENVHLIKDFAFAKTNISSIVKLHDEVVIKDNAFDKTPLEKSCMQQGEMILHGILLKIGNELSGDWYIGTDIKKINGKRPKLYWRHTKNIIIPETVEEIWNCEFMGYSDKVIIKNPNIRIWGTDNFFGQGAWHLRPLCLSFEEHGRTSDIMMVFPKFYHDNPNTVKAVSLYNKVMGSYGIDIDEYDENILHIGLSYWQMIDIAYKRVTGGYRLNRKHRIKYEEFLYRHRKKGLKHARKVHDEALEAYLRRIEEENKY